MSKADHRWDGPDTTADARRLGALPPPAAPGANAADAGLLSPGQILSAPSSGRLRQLPPPRHVPDAVPLDVDELERIAVRASQRRHTPRFEPDASTASLLGLDTPALTPPTGMSLPASSQRAATIAAAPPAVAAPAATTPATPPAAALPAAAPPAAAPPVPPPVVAVLPAPPAPPSHTTTVVGAGAPAPARRRRPALLAASVAAFAVVSLLTAAWAQQRRHTNSAERTASVATSATSPATTATAAVPVTAASSTAAPVTNAPVTNAPAKTETTTVAPTTATPAPPTTASATTEVTAPAPTTSPPPSVLGTTVLNRELLDALGTGTLPGGKLWPVATYADGRLVVSGAVPDRATADAMLRTAAGLATADVVDDRLTVEADAPAVRYLLVRLFDNPVFDRGYTSLRKDSQPVFELWAKRLRDQPAATVVLIAHGDGTSTSLAATRVRNAKDKLISVGVSSAEQIDAQWSAGTTAGPRLDFAIPVG